MTRRRGLTQKWERNIFSVASTPHQLLKAEDLHLKLAQLLRSHSHNNVAFDVAVSQESVSHKIFAAFASLRYSQQDSGQTSFTHTFTHSQGQWI